MKVLLINGSPHKEGCTYTALCEVSDILNLNGIDTDVFWIGDRPLPGCAAYQKCRDFNSCAFIDSASDFLDLAGDYDGFIFGTPAQWAGAAGAMTCFLDRAFYADLNGGGRRFYLKPAAAVISARRTGTAAAWVQMNQYFGLMQMPIITSRNWNMVHGATPEEVRQDSEGIQAMRMLGHNMAYFLKCKDVGSKLIPFPPREDSEFIRSMQRNPG